MLPPLLSKHLGELGGGHLQMVCWFDPTVFLLTPGLGQLGNRLGLRKAGHLEPWDQAGLGKDTAGTL